MTDCATAETNCVAAALIAVLLLYADFAPAASLADYAASAVVSGCAASKAGYAAAKAGCVLPWPAVLLL